MFGQLGMWRGHEDAHKFGADRVVNQALAEWGRLKLAEADPDAPKPRERRRGRSIEMEASS